MNWVVELAKDMITWILILIIIGAGFYLAWETFRDIMEKKFFEK